jgi:hypothetical protein
MLAEPFDHLNRIASHRTEIRPAETLEFLARKYPGIAIAIQIVKIPALALNSAFFLSRVPHSILQNHIAANKASSTDEEAYFPLQHFDRYRR